MPHPDRQGGIPGRLGEGSLGQVLVCTDARDGSRFLFNTDTVENFRHSRRTGISTFSVTTLDGEVLHLSSEMDDFLTCEERDD